MIKMRNMGVVAVTIINDNHPLSNGDRHHTVKQNKSTIIVRKWRNNKKVGGEKKKGW